MWDETAVICEVIWVRREEEIFLEMGLDMHPKSAAGASSRTDWSPLPLWEATEININEIRPPKCVIDRAPASGVPIMILRAHCIFRVGVFIVEKSVFTMPLTPKVTTKQTTAFLPT